VGCGVTTSFDDEDACARCCTDRDGAQLRVGDMVQVRGQDIVGVVLRLHAATVIVSPCDAELECRYRDLRRVATAEECGGAPPDDPPDPDYDGPMVPAGGAS